MTRPTPRALVVPGTVALLLLLPFPIYWSAVIHRYGLRDDYAILREAREEPGKILRVCASQGRPLYGWMLEASARAAGGIDGLTGLRLLGVAGLGVLAAAVFLMLRKEGWRTASAALLAGFLTLTPSAQVIANWGICWPQAVALMLGLTAFALARRAIGRPEEAVSHPVRWAVAAVGAMCAATLIYQVSGLFYAVLLAAALVVRRDTSLKDTARWMARHLWVMGLGLAVAYLITKVTFATGLFTPSTRIVFEKHWVDKTVWALTHVFPNALALSALNETLGGDMDGYWAMVVLTLTLLGVGVAVEGRRSGLIGVGRWLLALVTLSAAAYSVSFLAGERWPTYRTLNALTGVWAVFFAASLVNLGTVWPRHGPRLATLLLTAFVGFSALLAHEQSLELFALPQGRELALMEEGANLVVPAWKPRVFVLTAKQTDSSAPFRYLDEFGSVSVDSEWVAKEMLKALVKERFPREHDVSGLYRFAAGPVAPEPRSYDILIDMRRQHVSAARPVVQQPR
ncbi:hypothetical protein D7V97_01950 [Corallococcus sp. CA053C]|uniref:hypothetical protein n=1 Tax=Corallococcus sp. CA053C TaxID=2316732 RepID=UPI000EA24981|nr:hypothetical protein [Corallococcus sp. CA053C]RKH14881.1 hypothetical protein D7V97_01950 [Corallococcus sp. CA053C]